MTCWHSSPLARWKQTNSESTPLSQATGRQRREGGRPFGTLGAGIPGSGQGRRPDPILEQGDPLSQRKRAELCDEHVGRVLVSRVREPLEEGGSAGLYHNLDQIHAIKESEQQSAHSQPHAPQVQGLGQPSEDLSMIRQHQNRSRLGRHPPILAR